MDVQEIRSIADRMRGEIRKAVVGQDEVIDLMLTSLLVGGHILLEGVPGTAKTLITRAFAAGLELQFGRLQFTPDLTQAALLQAMNERTVTIDGKDYPLGDEFMVVATQNPIEQQGTYPLPEAQLDRFLFKIIIDYPSRDEEREIVARHGHRSAMPRIDDFGLAAVVAADGLAYARQAVTQIRLTDVLIDYIVDVARATREHTSIEHGASTRAANMLASSSRAYAATQGRDFVIPDDIKALAVPLLRHRVVLSPSAEIEGLTSDQVIRDVLDRTAAPR